MDENRNYRQRRRRNTVSGSSPPKKAEVATYQTLEDYKRPVKEFEQLLMEENEQFMEAMNDEPLSVRSYSPDQMSVASSMISSVSSSVAFLPNIGDRRSKSFSGLHYSEKSIGSSCNSLSFEDHDDHSDYGNISRRSSASSSHSSTLTIPSERLSVTTNRLLNRQRRLSEITTPHDMMKMRNGEEHFFTRLNNNENNDNNNHPNMSARHHRRRESLPPLKLPMSQSQAGYSLAGKYYKRWRDNRKSKGSLPSNSSSTDEAIQEEKISLQKHVTFSPEFEKVFNALIINDSLEDTRDQ